MKTYIGSYDVGNPEGMIGDEGKDIAGMFCYILVTERNIENAARLMCNDIRTKGGVVNDEEWIYDTDCFDTNHLSATQQTIFRKCVQMCRTDGAQYIVLSGYVDE